MASPRFDLRLHLNALPWLCGAALLALLAICALAGVRDPLHWLALGALAGLLWLLVQRFCRQLANEVMALNLQADSLRDQSFNLAANREVLSLLRPLAGSLDAMAGDLARQRATLYQRELLLDTVLQSSPSALVLTDEQGRVLLSNPAARQLLSGGRKFDGKLLSEVLAPMPQVLAACLAQQQGLMHLGDDDGIWHLSVSPFRLNQRQHWLYLLKPMTREFKQEEIKAWKKLIRVIGHELNNSLAPMSSLAFSGNRLLQQGTPDPAKLAEIFLHIGERCRELNSFLQGYLTFAKLPPPVLAPVQWAALLNALQNQYEFELEGDLPGRCWLADQSQLMQLLVNLLKNAKEAGASSAGTVLRILESPAQLMLELQDDGGGLPDEVLQHALVPFYTTKAQGSGIGLTLCRDIMESHGGSLQLVNQPGGLLVRLSFVAQQASASA